MKTIAEFEQWLETDGFHAEIIVCPSDFDFLADRRGLGLVERRDGVLSWSGRLEAAASL